MSGAWLKGGHIRRSPRTTSTTEGASMTIVATEAAAVSQAAVATDAPAAALAKAAVADAAT
eukprot:322928-Chlamydomonas_euryale.AAC.1